MMGAGVIARPHRWRIAFGAVKQAIGLALELPKPPPRTATVDLHTATLSGAQRLRLLGALDFRSSPRNRNIDGDLPAP